MDSEKKMDVNKYTSFARNAANEKHRTRRNIELLCQICRLEVSK